MDFTMLKDHFVVIVVLACLIVGYIIKHTTFLKKIPNDDIPAILAVIGAVLNGFVSGWSVENVVYGAFMGLASTGLHQAFKSFVEGTSNVDKDNINKEATTEDDLND